MAVWSDVTPVKPDAVLPPSVRKPLPLKNADRSGIGPKVVQPWAMLPLLVPPHTSVIVRTDGAPKARAMSASDAVASKRLR